jgi:hypothetical protein
MRASKKDLERIHSQDLLIPLGIREGDTVPAFEFGWKTAAGTRNMGGEF